jgi:Ca-activated chloride channel family protein
MSAPCQSARERLDCITLVHRVGRGLAGPSSWLLGLAIVAGGAAVGAQFTSGVNLVEVYASVTDSHGEPQSGLTPDDFELQENGERQQISNFAAGEFPLSVAVALDRSFSMSGRRLGLAKAAARAFLGELRPQDQSMVVAIGSEVDILAPLSTDRSLQFRALAGVEPFGTTGLYDAILQTIDDVQPARGRRALVLLSDGDDRYSKAAASDAIERARRSDVMIFPVALGAARPPLFAELATISGGRSYHARDAATLTATLRAIARELRQQYLLGYTPSRPLVAGSADWRSITVVVKRPGLQVRARDGYMVK